MNTCNYPCREFHRKSQWSRCCIAPQGKKVWNCIELWMKSGFFLFRFPYTETVFAKKWRDVLYICISWRCRNKKLNPTSSMELWYNVTNTNTKKNIALRSKDTDLLVIYQGIVWKWNDKPKRMRQKSSFVLTIRFDTWIKWSDHSMDFKFLSLC